MTSKKKKMFTDSDGVIFNEEQTTLIEYPKEKTESIYSIPSGVTEIGKHAFYGCDKLKIIIMPYGVTLIGKYAFSACDNLIAITTPDCVTHIGKHSFLRHDRYAFAALPESVVRIDREAFSRCNQFIGITIPRYVTSIGEDVFYSCESLKHIFVHEDNEVYSDVDGVLFSKDKATLMKIPRNSPIERYHVPDNVNSIDINAFQGCKNLTHVCLPENYVLTRALVLDEDDMAEVSKLRAIFGEINLGEEGLGRMAIGSIFQGCDSLESVHIPYGVTRIGPIAFLDCKNLIRVFIPDSVTEIGTNAFYGCARLANVYIPGSVAKLGAGAFRDCRSLVDITIPDSVVSIEPEVFDNCRFLTIHCNENSVAHIYAEENGIKIGFDA